MKKTLVVGGTGFIGQRVTRRLTHRGIPVVCMDVRVNGGEFGDLGTAATVVQADVTRFDDLVAVVREHQPDRIIQLAYLLGEGERQPHIATRVNVIGIDNVFEVARLSGIERVVYASSIAYHGSSQASFGDREVTEDDARGRSGVYAACKQFNEAMAECYEGLYGLKAIAVRPSFAIGEGKPRGRRDHIECITGPALGREVRSPMRSSARFLLAHVEDVAELFVRVALAESPKHSVYHTGGHSTTLGELFEVVREFLPDADVHFDDENGLDGFLIHRVDASRARNEFGFELRSLRQMVRDIIMATRAGAGLPVELDEERGLSS